MDRTSHDDPQSSAGFLQHLDSAFTVAKLLTQSDLAAEEFAYRAVASCQIFRVRAAEDRIGQLEGRGRTSSESRHSRRALARYNQERD